MLAREFWESKTTNFQAAKFEKHWFTQTFPLKGNFLNLFVLTCTLIGGNKNYLLLQWTRIDFELYKLLYASDIF